jgi:AraC family transcriptional activator of tynA and feaB
MGIAVETVFSTKEVHPRDRFEYWHEIACKIIVDHSSKPESRQSFEAKLQVGAIADVGLVLFENSPMDVLHTQRQVAHATGDKLFVCRQVAGTLVLEQSGREIVLEPGDVTLLDPLLPYAGKFQQGSKALVVKVPRRALEARVGKTRDMTTRVMRPVHGEYNLMSWILATLPANAGRLGSAAEEILKEQALDWIAVSLAKMTEGHTPRLSSARSLASMSIRAAIEARLADPCLSVNSVAAAAGVSIRYANAVLAEEDMSIMRLVQARRLERCRRALEDPLQSRRTVSEIAYGWGFSDMTHFGRRFKAAYGMLPRDCRRLARTDLAKDI